MVVIKFLHMKENKNGAIGGRLINDTGAHEEKIYMKKILLGKRRVLLVT